MSTTSTTTQPEAPQALIGTCLDAALQISWAGRMPIFKEASTTYALNFLSLYLLTEGVTLCIMASWNPLSHESFESKLGIRRLMEMQVSLKSDSIVSDERFQLLEKLLPLFMKKEIQSMFEFR